MVCPSLLSFWSALINSVVSISHGWFFDQSAFSSMLTCFSVVFLSDGRLRFGMGCELPLVQRKGAGFVDVSASMLKLVLIHWLFPWLLVSWSVADSMMALSGMV